MNNISTLKSQFPNLKAVMFDMDGVLFDSMKNHAHAWFETMQHFGFTDFTEQEAYMHEGRTGAGTINIVSQRMFGHDADPQQIEEIYAYKSQLFNKLPKAEPMAGAAEVLDTVKRLGLTPILVTGSGQKTLLDRLNKHFPATFIPELMVTAFDVKYGKPNPEPYLMGMQKYNAYKSLNLGVSSFVVVENAPLGVHAGVAAEVPTLAVNTGPLPDEVLLDEGACMLFHTMHELADYFAN